MLSGKTDASDVPSRSVRPGDNVSDNHVPISTFPLNRPPKHTEK